MSQRTIFLSRLIGLYCVIFALSMVAHEQAMVNAVTELVHSPGVVLAFGAVVVAAGLAMVLGHNVWSGGPLAIVVTLVGWLILAKGVVLIFLSPEGIVAYFDALHYEQLFVVYAAITLIIGAYLTYSGFSQTASATPRSR
jgi:hypothetical protein